MISYGYLWVLEGKKILEGNKATAWKTVSSGTGITTTSAILHASLAALVLGKEDMSVLIIFSCDICNLKVTVINGPKVGVHRKRVPAGGRG